MNEQNSNGAPETTNETSAPETTTAPVKAPRKSKSKAPPEQTAPPKRAPMLKLSARQRSNVDAFDNGATKSASVINHVLACAGRPLSTSEITALALVVAPDKFNERKAHGRVANHMRHLLTRALVINVGGAWRIVGAVGAATKQLRESAPAKLKRVALKGAPKNETNENEAPPAE